MLSYKRSSFEDDLKDVDLVFGEHSVSMLDAGFKNVLFASCNVTGHRNFWEDGYFLAYRDGVYGFVDAKYVK